MPRGPDYSTLYVVYSLRRRPRGRQILMVFGLGKLLSWSRQYAQLVWVVNHSLCLVYTVRALNGRFEMGVGWEELSRPTLPPRARPR